MVEPIQAQPKKERAIKLTKGGKIALAALREAIGELGAIPPVSNHIPAGVKTVTVSQWRDYAYRQGVAGSDEPRARRLAFQRAHEALVAAKQVAVWEPYAWAV
ncbi:hypothetical protein [Methylocapsa palsarum]|uniref:hypothetical protein n=1 Tax=Methylocapsa palsarum TaxID=1612308 RepID=UPI001FCD64B6|nr:hypothetical protein [Methylocapsa palsarum]